MKLQIIVGSTRPGRVSDRVAKWVALEAKNLPDTTVEVVDLADYNMPFLDEPISPQFNPERKPNPAAKKWLDKTSEADAFVLVTPEYNRSYSAVLKNALDYLDFQFAKKPVALAAHGTTGGAQAVAHLRGVLPGLYAVTVPTATFLVGRAGEAIDEAGNLNEEAKANPYGPQTTLKKMLEDTKWYSDALASARASK
ncbi:MAG TPA: NAD(P)H-dependent oxidoreductase [Candidatus Binatia bacterium]|jgi:NAD(P)H-dependent FMN reductase|nr:NAD(P)H-dependent oxidoreductase [Candidatus Binatia bacterium]